MPGITYDAPVLTFIVIPVALAAAFGWGVHAAWRRRQPAFPHSASAVRAACLALAAAAAWMTVTWLAATSGILQRWETTPPPFALLVLSIITIAVAVAASPLGGALAALPLWMLIAVQGFRLPLELAMHAMYERGVMPVQMSYSGRNFDIVTGATALVVAYLVATRRAGPRVAFAWNSVGLGLLLNVVIVAIVGTPRIRYFGDDFLNTWVTYPPFVWLPAVMVLAALLGHLLIFRAISRSAVSTPSPAARAL